MPLLSASDFLFRLFSQKMYLYSLVLRIDTKLGKTGTDVISSIVVDWEGQQRLKDLRVGEGMDIGVQEREKGVEIKVSEQKGQGFLLIQLGSPVSESPEPSVLSPDEY